MNDASTLEYWLALLLPAGATFVAVLLAFWLDRIAERRREEVAVLWAARHATAHFARLMTEEPYNSVLRLVVDGRRGPSRQDVFRRLAEVHPALPWAWNLATSDMISSYERQRGIWPRRLENRELKEKAKLIDEALDRASKAWPLRRQRIARLLDDFGVEPVR